MPFGDGFDALIDGLYEAAVIPERWQGWLEGLARDCDATAALFSRIGEARLSIVSTSDTFKEMWDEIWLAQGGAQNERTKRAVAFQHAGFITDGDVFAPGEAEQLSLYRDFLIPRGYGSGVATAISIPSGDFAMVNLEKPFAAGPFPRTIVAALDRVRPHLARAALIANHLEVERARSAAAALELMRLAAAVLGKGGRILAANSLLTRLMPSAIEDLPSRLKLTDAGADALFATALEALGRGGQMAAVRSIPMRARNDLPPIIFHLVPVKGAAHDLFGQATAILIATPLVQAKAPSADLVAGLFDLSPSEARLAALIAGGHAPREAAVMLGWTEGTARTTLRQVFAKTGMTRQADLVGLLRGAVAS
ncbi:helix-turn-helix transcriptional regulator [Bosea sp. LjRoot90]|uniref:helix-turn-helix transcriptional regulator n=1 Tax=Bosea sp. LjRoot90 TaxID=3342342 RepID=UPI003ECD68F5